MNCQQALHVQPGITAVIGSGGKTTLLRELARELCNDGATVMLTTTTHFLPFPDMASGVGMSMVQLADALSQHGAVYVGTPVEGGKLCAPALSPAELVKIADYVLVEADGSKRLPLKAHAAWEPVIPDGCEQVILVVGASGLNKPVAEVVHRPEVFCKLAGCAQTDLATPERVARAINTERLADRVAINQADSPQALLAAQKLADLLDAPACYGSFRAHELTAS